MATEHAGKETPREKKSRANAAYRSKVKADPSAYKAHLANARAASNRKSMAKSRAIAKVTRGTAVDGKLPPLVDRRQELEARDKRREKKLDRAQLQVDHLAAIAQAALDLIEMTDTAPFKPRHSFAVDASVVQDLRRRLVDGGIIGGQVKATSAKHPSGYLRQPPCNHKEAGPKPRSLEALLRDTRRERDKWRKRATEAAERAVFLESRVAELETREQGRDNGGTGE